MTALRIPLVSAFLAFLGGLLLGLRVEMVPASAALAAVLVLAAAALHRPVTGMAMPRRATHAALLAALALAGAGDAALARSDAAGDCRSTLADGAALSVTGALAADFAPPRDSTERIPLLPLQVARASVRGQLVERCDVEVRLRLPRGAPALAAGTELRVMGEWRLLPSPVDPSRWPADPAYRGYVLARTAAVAAPAAFARHPLLALRGRAERQIRRLFPRNAPLADALVLGRRETLDRAVADRFAASGLVHLLAISGTHVALVAAALMLLARVVRVRRDAAVWLTIVLVALYLAMIGAPPSAVRSGIMTALTLLTLVLQRPSSPFSIIAAAAFVILALEPMAALDAGVQLSFAGVLGILVLRRAMLDRVPPRLREGKVVRPLTESLVVSVAAFVATAPIAAHHFGQAAPVSILANLPAIPLSSLALVGIGAACAIEPLSPGLARLVADGASLAMDALQKIVDVAAAVPGGHAAVARPAWWLWAAAALAFLLALEWSARMRQRVRWAVAPAAAGTVFLLLPLAAAPARGLEIVILDVGQGDAIALHTPGDRWVLVDAGPADEHFDAGARRVLPYLRAHGARRVEAMVLTHPHVDHIGGAPAVMRGMPVERLIDPGLAFGTPQYLGVLAVAESTHVHWAAARQDRALRIDGVELTFLWPAADVLDAPADANDISAVVELRYGAFSMLLTGDAPDFVEHALVARYGDRLRSAVLKAGHHGSRTASSQELLETVRPALAVISCGRRNRYGHPAPETVARLRSDGIDVARTDLDGTVTIDVDPGGRSWHRETQ
ncbi:DNA internalization-related competence protein ComEC/Rec2 [Longimicrobium sp.]|uniref:DNA internalization-related competence protein ComEC/Rec2 n=1 Tax=Longimicrobium sp. TaxID=2029185 RepID=UPI002C8929A4|nr:DNA internalization-related competence protein ComEC/Rec2 [Longimicrobium sp.]HSU12837.1 DNA internalization-related competence protein ComEC/Rec2 [Longimicrobium sp.]